MAEGKILIVDDERKIRESTRLLLVDEGYQAEVAQDGKEAIEILERTSFDLVITDLVMPNLDGFALIDYIRKTTPQVLVIVITAYASLESAIEAMHKGAYDYLIKPFDFELLKITVEKALDRIGLEKEMIRMARLSALGEMSAAIGHELNNYLNALTLHAQMLPKFIEQGDPDKVAKYASIIAEYCSKLNRLTQGFLDFGRLETQIREASLNDIIQKTLDFIAPQNAYDQIDFILKLDPQIPVLQLDPEQIQQVIINLVSNAAEAMDGKGRITLITHYEPDTDWVELQVVDEGKGIAEKDLSQIFEPHFTTKERGHGFGLAICYRIIKEHRGKIKVKSREGEGTTFTILLPKSLPSPSSKSKS
jgi:signal transduction histidine kinase